MRQKRYFCLIITVICFLLMEVFSFGALYYLKTFKNKVFVSKNNIITKKQKQKIKQIIKSETKYIDYDKDLGWRIKASGEGFIYKANKQGIRSDREYSINPTNDIVRIATFGNSFTHGNEVSFDETWQAFMESTQKQIEVLNFGVGGYGVDQAYLQYLKEGKKYEPDIVLICFMQEDFFHHLNVFRPFYSHQTGFPLTKPRFILKNNRLELLENPIKNREEYLMILSKERSVFEKLENNDYFWEWLPSASVFDVFSTVRLCKTLFYDEFKRIDYVLKEGVFDSQTEEFKITEKIIDAFYSEVLSSGAIPVIVVIPNRLTFREYGLEQTKRHDEFVSLWRERQYNYIDIMDSFFSTVGPENIPSLFAQNKHFNPEGNKYIAEFILQYLKKKKMVP